MESTRKNYVMCVPKGTITTHNKEIKIVDVSDFTALFLTCECEIIDQY